MQPTNYRSDNFNCLQCFRADHAAISTAIRQEFNHSLFGAGLVKHLNADATPATVSNDEAALEVTEETGLF
jgi:hypothetical protein